MANLKDFATSLILTGPSPATSGTSVVVSSGEGALYPPVPFWATAHPENTLPVIANAEKVLVTARPGNADTFTIVRAQSPTTAKSIVAGWRLSNTIFADDMYQGSIISNEIPSGTINGSNTAFTVATAFTPGSLKVFLNGQRLKSGAGNDYTENASNTAFTMLYAPATGDVLLVDYNIGSSVIMQGTNVFVNQETPTGSVNGSNAAFTTSKGYVSGTLEVYVNGLLQAKTTHATEVSPTAGTFTLDVAPSTGDIVRVSYQWAASTGGNAATVNGIAASVSPTANQLVPLDASALFPGAAIKNVTVNRQDNTTNSTPTTTRIETGWGVIANGAGVSAALSKAITFQTPFTSIPIVIAVCGGDHSSSTTYGAGGNLVEGRIAAKAVGPSTTGFTVWVHQEGGTNFATGNTFFQWIAIGV